MGAGAALAGSNTVESRLERIGGDEFGEPDGVEVEKPMRAWGGDVFSVTSRPIVIKGSEEVREGDLERALSERRSCGHPQLVAGRGDRPSRFRTGQAAFIGGEAGRLLHRPCR